MADSVGGVGEPRHLPAVVDRVGLAGGPAKGADVGDGTVLPPVFQRTA